MRHRVPAPLHDLASRHRKDAMNSVPSVMYSYVRARQLEGTYPGHHKTGCFAISGLRIARGWGGPCSTQWPYDGSAANWPPVEPPDMDEAAKPFRICAYQRVRSVEECKSALRQDIPVMVALEITEDWHSPAGGKIGMPKPDAKSKGSHSVLICSYNDTETSFAFQNSWGADWGDKGFGYIPQRYFEIYQIEAWTIFPELLDKLVGDGIRNRAWGLPDCFAKTPLVGVEVYDAPNDECIGWAFLVARQGFADIEEFFVRPTYRGKGYGTDLEHVPMRSTHPPTSSPGLSR
jgi:GNAT superfamily N-acetyltransferase